MRRLGRGAAPLTAGSLRVSRSLQSRHLRPHFADKAAEAQGANVFSKVTKQ